MRSWDKAVYQLLLLLLVSTVPRAVGAQYSKMHAICSTPRVGFTMCCGRYVMSRARSRRWGQMAMAGATVKASSTLTDVRTELIKRGIDAFLVPSGDEHLSEYAPQHFCRRAYLSGFDGSAGTAVITPAQALLWTDGRYYQQAEQQLGPAWTLMRDGMKDVPSIASWLANCLPKDAVVGIDPKVHSGSFIKSLGKDLRQKAIEIRPLGEKDRNPVDIAWGKRRPAEPDSRIWVHPIEHAGKTVFDKVAKIKAEMDKEGADVLVVGMLDEAAWLLNIRGNAVPNSPLPLAYAAVEVHRQTAAEDTRTLIFVHRQKLDDTAITHLQEACRAEIRDYTEIFSYLRHAEASGKKLWLDPDRTNYALLQAAGLGHEQAGRGNEELRRNARLIQKVSPIIRLKALKNGVELQCMKDTHLRDGAAEVEFFAWLDDEIQKRSISELEIDQVLTHFRSRRPKFLGLSFDTVAGTGANGAIIHYRATAESHGIMDRSKLLLLDSGAQYEDGTTDVTRTVHFGEPKEEEKVAFTKVLQGHIAIDTAIWPEGLPGFFIDAFARRSLWQSGMDYAHGTGHGVGAALNVHEGPQGISYNSANQTPLQPGMVISNEPGYYLPGKFGIRTENLLIVVEKANGDKDPRKRRYLGFERLTHIPISKRLIVQELLQRWEVDWLDAYHRDVWERVGPLVEGRAREWLKEACLPL